MHQSNPDTLSTCDYVGEYTVAYRIPTTGTGKTATNALTSMFKATGGTFKETPSINTIYYLSNTNQVIPQVTLISFTINSESGGYGTATYEAEQNMTWADWANSSYFPSSFPGSMISTSGTWVKLDGVTIRNSGGVTQKPSDILVDKEVYSDV